MFQKETSPLQLELSQLPVIRVSDRPYKCNYPGCKKAYMWKRHLKRHKQHAHSPPKYHCPIPDCNNVFRWKDDRTKHIKYVHNFDESQRLSCPEPNCDSTFKDPKDLRDHIRYIHTNIIRQKCPYPDCNRTYKRKSGLNEHIRFVHLDVRPHICKICGEQYRQRYLLTYHLKHDLCWHNHGKLRAKYTKQHHITVNQLEQFLREVKNPKSTYTEVILPNKRRLDLLVYCPDDRIVGFDATIGRSTTPALRRTIMKKCVRDYEQFCDIIYVVVISKAKFTLQIIQECNKSPTKPKAVRVVHWRSIVRDNPKFVRIFQQIEDEAAL